MFKGLEKVFDIIGEILAVALVVVFALSLIHIYKHLINALSERSVQSPPQPEHEREHRHAENIAPDLFKTQCLFQIPRRPLRHGTFARTAEKDA